MKGIKLMEEFLQVGAIANTHGIAGEVKVFPMTDDIKRFKKLKEVYLDTRLPLNINTLPIKNAIITAYNATTFLFKYLISSVPYFISSITFILVKRNTKLLKS